MTIVKVQQPPVRIMNSHKLTTATNIIVYYNHWSFTYALSVEIFHSLLLTLQGHKSLPQTFCHCQLRQPIEFYLCTVCKNLSFIIILQATNRWVQASTSPCHKRFGDSFATGWRPLASRLTCGPRHCYRCVVSQFLW